MTTYISTIKHHSVSSARMIKTDGSLIAAKRAATNEFGDEFNGHLICIYATHPNGEPDTDFIVSSRRIGRGKWKDNV